MSEEQIEQYVESLREMHDELEVQGDHTYDARELICQLIEELNNIVE